MMRQLNLPDGLNVFSLVADETRFVHREVFGGRCYLQHGIELHDGDCVFDVGANIGLSVLFFHLERQHVRIFAFEPSPASCECLKANVELHSVDARVFECGLSRNSGTAEFTFYPGNTILSGFHADLETDRGTTKQYMVNSGFTPQNADKMVGMLFKKLTLSCPLRTLSEIIDEEKVTRIDLLKIDAEKSEAEILAGIRPEHWSLIQQTVIEVSDESGRLSAIQRLLADHGFQVVTDQDPLLKNTALFNVFATRRK
jgi:31-O-methyltransferase